MRRMIVVLMTVAGFMAPVMSADVPHMVLRVRLEAWPEIDEASCEETIHPVEPVRCWSCRLRDAVVLGVPVEWVTVLETRGKVRSRSYWIPREKLFDVMGMLTEYYGPPEWRAWSAWRKDEKDRDVLQHVNHELAWTIVVDGRRYRVTAGGVFSRPPVEVGELGPCHPRALKGRWSVVGVEALGPAGKGGKADGGEDREDAHEPRPQAPKK